ncbi:NAD(P)H-quinone oxidoreductase [Methylocucumis oryzae]|uniref:NAD(P)H-quinone oxidoreductase n=1 Tax=Methylocucumis oryzae TaxID=1632867 RepID=UPI000ADDD667
MRAIEIINHQLHCGEREPPTPNAEQVLIKVHAAGVNRPDVMQRKGLYPPPPGASDIPGLEIAGVIETVGVNVTEFKPGDVVCALVTGGGYAEYCLANPRLCLPIPEHWSFVEAASIPETYFTVWSNVFNRAKLDAKQTLLVHGGSSGIGITAIQLAKAFGAQVFVTVGNELKQQACLALGADAAINYRSQDFVAEILKLTDNNGVNVILDMVGGDYCARNLTCLAIEGTLIQNCVAASC